MQWRNWNRKKIFLILAVVLSCCTIITAIPDCETGFIVNAIDEGYNNTQTFVVYDATNREWDIEFHSYFDETGSGVGSLSEDGYDNYDRIASLSIPNEYLNLALVKGQACLDVNIDYPNIILSTDQTPILVQRSSEQSLSIEFYKLDDQNRDSSYEIFGATEAHKNEKSGTAMHRLSTIQFRYSGMDLDITNE